MKALSLKLALINIVKFTMTDSFLFCWMFGISMLPLILVGASFDFILKTGVISFVICVIMFEFIIKKIYKKKIEEIRNMLYELEKKLITNK